MSKLIKRTTNGNSFGMTSVKRNKRGILIRTLKNKAGPLPIDLRTINVGIPWWVQMLAGLAISAGTTVVQTAAGPKVAAATTAGATQTAIGTTVNLKTAVASQLIVSTGTTLGKQMVQKVVRVATTNRQGNTEIHHMVEQVGEEVSSHNIENHVGTQTDFTPSTWFDNLPGLNWLWGLGLSVGTKLLIAKLIRKLHQPSGCVNDSAGAETATEAVCVESDSKIIMDKIKNNELDAEELNAIKNELVNTIAKTEQLQLIGVPT